MNAQCPPCTGTCQQGRSCPVRAARDLNLYAPLRDKQDTPIASADNTVGAIAWVIATLIGIFALGICVCVGNVAYLIVAALWS